MIAVSSAQTEESSGAARHNRLRLSKLRASSRYQHANTPHTSSVTYSTDMDGEVSGTPNPRQAKM